MRSRARRVDPVAVVANAPEHPVPPTSAAALAVPATSRAPLASLHPPALGGRPSPAAVVRRGEPAPASTALRADIALVGSCAGGVSRLAAHVRAVCLLAPGPARRAVAAAGGTRARRVTTLGPSRPRLLRPRPRGVLLTQRRVPIPWGTLGRERLLAAWARILRDHALSADDVRLLGVYGPAPLGAVDGVALDPDGERALVALRRTRVPGPIGDLALARHLPTGRLVTAAVPSDEAAEGRPPNRPSNRRRTVR